MSEPPRLSLSGNLHLVCSAHAERGTYLSEQAFSAPLHLSKAYWDGETLLVHLVNQTAGLFGGDTINTRIVVERGARVLLSSPSAARFHASHGREIRLAQVFEVHAGGSLEVFPEIAIPQRDSCSFQKTEIHLEPGAELIYLETLAPGRVAHGESFAFRRYGWSTEIRVGEKLVLHERAALSPGDSSLAALRAFSPASYYAGFVVISPHAEAWGIDFQSAAAQAMQGLPVQAGASRLNAAGWSFRVLAPDSLVLRESIRRLRDLIYQHLGLRPPDPRRNG